LPAWETFLVAGTAVGEVLDRVFAAGFFAAAFLLAVADASLVTDSTRVPSASARMRAASAESAV
jgi:hypothetical protein